MWKRTLIAQLDWGAVYTWWHQDSSYGYIAPSWSWASVISTSVQFPPRYNTYAPLKHTQDLVTIVEASVTPKYDGATYGAVCEGHLLLRGIRQPCRQTREGDGGHFKYKIDWRSIATNSGADIDGFEEKHKRLHEIDESRYCNFSVTSEVKYSTPETPSTDALLCLPTMAYQKGQSSSVRTGIVDIFFSQ